MEKASVKLNEAYRLVNPGVVVLVSVGDGEQDNLFAVGWNVPARKDPPMLALTVGKRHHSWPFIEEMGELGVNVPDASLANQVLGCGKTTGREEPDKFARFGLTRQPAKKIKAPLVENALANLECRVNQVVDLGESALLVAQVVHAVATTEHFRDGHWQFDRGLCLLHHLSGDRFCTSDELRVAYVP
jgi:flavin reductase (DIM6/NTAB) family NADH-FMN oxidoreductase RutF